MAYRGVIYYERAPGATLKLLRAAAAAGNAAAVEHWHEHFRAGHFTPAGGRKYGYQPRKGDNEPPRVVSRSTNPRYAGRTVANPHYSWQKRRRMKHNKPLVWSGRSEQASKVMKVTATSKRGVGAFTALPKYFYQFRRDLKTPDKAAELTTVVSDEAEAMARVHRDAMTAHLNAARDPAVKKIA